MQPIKIYSSMRNCFCYIIMITAFLLSTGCKKKDVPQPPPEEKPDPEPGTKKERAIYIAGTTDYIPTFWKNGIATELSHSTASGGATRILVDQSDIYVLGFEERGGFSISVPILWKNGVKTVLYDENVKITPSGIAIHKGDLYITGTLWSNNVPKALIWKNGTLISYLDKFENCSISSIASDGIHLYMGGAESINGRNKMLIWKDGKSQYLNGTATDGTIYDVTVKKGDFYACGYEQEGPAYWKNFDRIPLDTAGKSVLFNLVPAKINVTDNKDVYVLSMENNNTPIYWKNGHLIKLIDKSKRNFFYSFAVHNDTVFTVGTSILGLYPPALYWKNEDVATLPQSTGKMPGQYNTGYAMDILITEE